MSELNDAKQFLTLVARGDVQEAYDHYVASDMVHHNQYFKGDRESLRQAMQEAHKEDPNTDFIIKQAYQDGNTVITVSRVGKKEQDIAAVHIMRFTKGKITEMWDICQFIDHDSPNEYGAL